MCAGAGAVCKFKYFKFIKTSQKYNLLYCLCVYVCLYCRLPAFVDALRIIYLYMRTKTCVHRRIVFSASAAVASSRELCSERRHFPDTSHILLSFQYFYIYIYVERIWCRVWCGCVERHSQTYRIQLCMCVPVPVH